MQKKLEKNHSKILPLNSAKLQSNLRKFSIFTQGCLVPIFTTRGVVAPPANNLIMSGTSIRSFRNLKHQNQSTGDYFIQSSGIICLVLFLATKEVLAPLANDPIMSGRLIQLFRHLECQNPSIILESIGIPNRSEKMGKKVRRRRNGTEERRNLIHILNRGPHGPSGRFRGLWPPLP